MGATRNTLCSRPNHGGKVWHNSLCAHCLLVLDTCSDGGSGLVQLALEFDLCSEDEIGSVPGVATHKQASPVIKIGYVKYNTRMSVLRPVEWPFLSEHGIYGSHCTLFGDSRGFEPVDDKQPTIEGVSMHLRPRYWSLKGRPERTFKEFELKYFHKGKPRTYVKALCVHLPRH